MSARLSTRVALIALARCARARQLARAAADRAGSPRRRAPVPAPTTVTALPGTAPSGQCDLLITPNSDSTHFTSAKLPSGEYNNFVGGGVTGHCPVQQITLIADSAEWFGDLAHVAPDRARALHGAAHHDGLRRRDLLSHG